MATMLFGLAVEFRRRETLVVLNVMPRDGTTVAAYWRPSVDGHLDGFVVLNPADGQLGIEYLQRLALLLVVHGRHKADVDYAFVDIDNFAAGKMMTEHLTDCMSLKD